MPGRLDLEFGFSRGAARRARSDGVKRLLLMGDFSGNASSAPRAALASRPTHKIDIDNVEQVMRRIAPGLRLPAGELAFAHLDDFHPDQLYTRLDLFQALRKARTDPGTEHGDLLGDLLGKPAASAAVPTRPAAPATGLDALIHNIVAPHIVRDTSAQSTAVRAAVDAATTEQMKDLLHDPVFRALEAAWRGVYWLVSNMELDGPVRLHLLDVGRAELMADMAAARDDVSRSALAGALCGPSFAASQDGGWSLIAGLFEFGPSVQDLQLLATLGAVASLAGGAFVAAAAPALFGCDAVADLPDPMRWTPLDVDAARNWSALRKSVFAPSIGLVAPRVLLRRPYGRSTDPIEQFTFEEQGATPEHETLLWGPGSLAVALMVGQSLANGEPDSAADQVTELDDLPAYTYTRDGEAELQPCAEALVGERAGQALLECGLMPLLSHRQRAAVQLMRLQSIAEPPGALAIG